MPSHKAGRAAKEKLMAHTPGPWMLGDYSESLGYDCMTGGVRCGPAVLDGADYGQKPCQDISVDALDRMLADARLIAAAPELLAALKGVLPWTDDDPDAPGYGVAIAAIAVIAKAEGRASEVLAAQEGTR